MNSGRISPHLNPLPANGARRRVVRQIMTTRARFSLATMAGKIRLSLSQRERMKVRDWLCGSPPRRTRLLAEHCRVLVEPDDSKIVRLRSPDARGTRLDHDLVCDRLHSCGRRRQAQQQVSRQDSKSRECKDQSGAADGICIQRNFDFADAAKEFVQLQFPCFAASERDSQQNNLIRTTCSREANLCFVPFFSAPHLSPLPATGERRMTQCSIDAEGEEPGHRVKTFAHGAAPLSFRKERW
jgi:hypothetical protein